MLVTPSQSFDEPVTVEQACKQLRITDPEHYEEVSRLISVARDFCERQTGRTLRVDITRVLNLAEWWDEEIYLAFPPLRSITHVKYYDTDEVLQTLASTNYRTELSTDGKSRLVWDDDADLPDIDDRPDAVQVTFVTGYETAELIPRTAIHAILTKATELWGSGTESEIKAAMTCTDRLLNTVDIAGYA
jgi:uncharacterized phiE125 gp8 family phage protein